MRNCDLLLAIKIVASDFLRDLSLPFGLLADYSLMWPRYIEIRWTHMLSSAGITCFLSFTFTSIQPQKPGVSSRISPK
jgi:hypothetical protein